MDPATAASAVALAVYDLEGGGAPSRWKGMQRPINLAAARRLGLATSAAPKYCTDAVLDQKMKVGEGGGGEGGEGGGGGEPRLILEFYELADEAVEQSLVAFDYVAGWYLLKHAPVARCIHRYKTYKMYDNMGDV